MQTQGAVLLHCAKLLHIHLSLFNLLQARGIMTDIEHRAFVRVELKNTQSCLDCEALKISAAAKSHQLHV